MPKTLQSHDSGRAAPPAATAPPAPLTPEQWDRELAFLQANFWSEAALTVLSAACTAGLLYAASHVAERLLPGFGGVESTSAHLDRLAERLQDCGRDPDIARTLDKYEMRILADLVEPADVGVAFKDIGGLASQKQDVVDRPV